MIYKKGVNLLKSIADSLGWDEIDIINVEWLLREYTGKEQFRSGLIIGLLIGWILGAFVVCLIYLF